MKTKVLIGGGLLLLAAYLGYRVYKAGVAVSTYAGVGSVPGLTDKQVRHTKIMAMLTRKPYTLGKPQVVTQMRSDGMTEEKAASWQRLIRGTHPASIHLVKGMR
jgi:hypothetical protein